MELDMSNKLIDKLFELCGDNVDLKLAIVSQPEQVKSGAGYSENPFFSTLLNSFGRVKEQVGSLVDDGLSFNKGDFYVYYGKGGIKVHETPKGVRKQLQRIAEKYNLNIIIYDGVLYEKDRISLTTDGRIDTVEIIKDSESLVKGGKIIAPFAVVTVFKGELIIAKKTFIIPEPEYKVIVNMGYSNNYPTMMAIKTVLKRVSNSIYSLLGVSLDVSDSEIIDGISNRLSEDYEDARHSEKPIKLQPDNLGVERINSENEKKVTEIKLDEI
jgi:recombinational DNA repair protein RecT